PFAARVQCQADVQPCAPLNAPWRCAAKLFPQRAIVRQGLSRPATPLRDQLKLSSELTRSAPADADPKGAARWPQLPGYAPPSARYIPAAGSIRCLISHIHGLLRLY